MSAASVQSTLTDEASTESAARIQGVRSLGQAIVDETVIKALSNVASFYGCSSCVLALRQNAVMHVVAACQRGNIVFEREVPLIDENKFQLFHHHVGRSLPTIVYDAADNERLKSEPCVVGEPHVRFYAAAPIYSASMECCGTLCIIDRMPRACFDLNEADYLRKQATTVANVLNLDAGQSSD
eukprot:TRINITY_DN19522_c0_g1_i1.p1 TRINITY_DN19522_c0_g1~~TRINITY_DN19522_c0_g1_i1.p1  ORF type:complete len:203 (+),score=26.83 TRINITY_DN19522_c0_g1_i1:63-611(+)